MGEEPRSWPHWLPLPLLASLQSQLPEHAIRASTAGNSKAILYSRHLSQYNSIHLGSVMEIIKDCLPSVDCKGLRREINCWQRGHATASSVPLTATNLHFLGGGGAARVIQCNLYLYTMHSPSPLCWFALSEHIPNLNMLQNTRCAAFSLWYQIAFHWYPRDTQCWYLNGRWEFVVSLMLSNKK